MPSSNLAPSSDCYFQPSLTPAAIETAGSAKPVFTDRRPSSRNERSSSTPALLLKNLPRDALSTPRAAFGEALTVRRAADSYRPEPISLPAPQSGRLERPSSSHSMPTTPTVARESAGMPEVWVTKWVDYSSKYGVGYILSDGSMGVYFNDSTKIMTAPDCRQFEYVTRRTPDRPEIRSTHSFNDYPEDLKKKVTLLRHFKSYLHPDIIERKDDAMPGESGLPIPSSRQQRSYEPGQVPYVKKWTKNRYAIMFQLSNKVVQVVFFDKTEAVLSSSSHSVTYVDKRGQINSYPLSNVLEVPNPELAKRLRYTREILVNLMGPRTDNLAGAAAADDALPSSTGLLSVR